MTANYHFLGIELSQGVKPRHLLVYFFVALVSSGYAGALSVLQPGLLQVMGIPHAEQATVTGYLSAMQELVFIAVLSLYGVLADRIGRRPVYAAGLLVNALGFVLYPHADSIAELALYRLIIALGSGAMVGMMVTVIADYVTNRDRGKANGLQALTATLGAFIPPILAYLPRVFVQDGMSEASAQVVTFSIAASLGAFAGFAALFGLAKYAGMTSHREPIITMLKAGLREARDPGVSLSYGAAFISRGDLAVTGAFMSLWLIQYGIAHEGMTPSQAMQELAVPRVLATVTGALLGSLIMGFVSDMVSRVTAVSIASGLAAAVYLSIFFVDDPTETWVMGLLFMMGIAEISAFVSSQALVGQQAPADRRGAVIGFFGVAGACGILVGTAGGGELFRNIGPSAPFVLFGLLNLVVFIWSLLVKNRVQIPDRYFDRVAG